MSDLVQRLREGGKYYYTDRSEAADRIEQLEAQNKELRGALELAKPHVEFAVRMSMPNSRNELATVNAALSADKGK